MAFFLGLSIVSILECLCYGCSWCCNKCDSPTEEEERLRQIWQDGKYFYNFFPMQMPIFFSSVKSNLWTISLQAWWITTFIQFQMKLLGEPNKGKKNLIEWRQDYVKWTIIWMKDHQQGNSYKIKFKIFFFTKIICEKSFFY